jgi:hypothetical protein
MLGVVISLYDQEISSGTTATSSNASSGKLLAVGSTVATALAFTAEL